MGWQSLLHSKIKLKLSIVAQLVIFTLRNVYHPHLRTPPWPLCTFIGEKKSCIQYFFSFVLITARYVLNTTECVLKQDQSNLCQTPGAKFEK